MSGSFFEIKPKIFIIMVIYMSLIYMTTTAFAYGSTQDNTRFGFYSGASVSYQTEKPYQNMTKSEKEAKQTEVAKKGAVEGGVLGFLIGGGIVVGSFLLGFATAGAGWVGVPWGLTIMGASTSIGALSGVGYEELKLEGIIEPIVPLEAVFSMITAFFDTVLNFINTLVSFLTFGIIKNSAIPSIPYPFNLVSFLLVFPVAIVCTIWIIGVVIEGVRSIKIPFSG